MNDAQIEELLLDDSAKKRGLGIGFAYVMRMLRTYYDGQMELQIKSGEGEGTTISIIIPRKSKEDFDD
ncbi:hypothetical protein D3C86_1816200 [compost metagenome]